MKIEKMLDHRSNLQKELWLKQRSKGMPEVPELHNIELFFLEYFQRLYPKAPQQKEKVSCVG